MTPSPLRMSASELLHTMAANEWRSQDIVHAHIQRIEEINPTLNAVIWPRFEAALTQAKEVDAARAAGHSTGRLAGLPMTLKDQFLLRGTPTSCGLAHHAERILSEQGPLVTRLQNEGAIFLGKTNLPQLLCSHECEHARYGAARNPWDLERTPGGSSGGEAAIIAAGGSPLGLGADMGGSLRIPAHCCGIHSLKPTAGRLPNGDTPLWLGHFGDLYGFEGFVNTPGPLARTVDDLKLALDCLLDPPTPNDEATTPAPWSSGSLPSAEGLRIGVFEENGVFAASPAVRRVCREAGQALQLQGLAVRGFEPPDPAEGMRIYLTLLCADGGAWIRQALAGEKPIDDIRAFMRLAGMPNTLRRPLSVLLGGLGQRHAAASIRRPAGIDAGAYWRLTAERSRYRTRFIAAMQQQEVDVLLCPPYALPAPQLGSNAEGAGTLAASHSALFNLLGMPAGTVAAGRVGTDEQSDRQPGRDKTERRAQQVETGSAGLPVGVQVVGRHWREIDVLHIMKTLETHFRQHPDYPSLPDRLGQRVGV